MADDEAGRSIDVGGEQSAAKQLSPIRLSIQATVILERRIISRSYWSVPSWYLHTVAIGEHLRAAVSTEAKTCAPAGASDKGDLFAWSGFDVILYKDACERYWHSLIGDKPLVYVGAQCAHSRRSLPIHGGVCTHALQATTFQKTQTA